MTRSLRRRTKGFGDYPTDRRQAPLAKLVHFFTSPEVRCSASHVIAMWIRDRPLG